MLFSLFRKKGEPKKTENKNKAPIGRKPVEPSSAKSAAPVASPQAVEDSLDFSDYVPPPQSAPLQDSPHPAPAPQAAPQEALADAAAPPLDVSTLRSAASHQGRTLGFGGLRIGRQGRIPPLAGGLDGRRELHPTAERLGRSRAYGYGAADGIGPHLDQEVYMSRPAIHTPTIAAGGALRPRQPPQDL